MLSETIAHLTRKIAKELDLLSDREGETHPLPAPALPPPALELPKTPLELADPGQPTLVEPAERPPPTEPRAPRRRSLREILGWRRYKVN